jgi:phosphoribosylformimino-5-aminoimidazole carboxamide ribotide isomerase
VEVIPAVDIKGGRCVRLYQGDYGRETVYSDSPVDMALHWVELGAARIHVVDLDAAKAGAPVNHETAGAIAAAVSVPVQLGGGVRSLETATHAAALGISRVIIGTAAARDMGLVLSVCEALGPERVVVSIDARGGYVALNGWTETTGLRVQDMLDGLGATGVRRFIYTDIARDGTLTEPSWDEIVKVHEATGLMMIVAGGVSSVEHLLRLSEIGVEAAIVGKAVYTGDIDLSDAVAALAAAN